MPCTCVWPRKDLWRALSRKKNWLEPELVSNSERARAMVPYALNGSAGCSLNRPLSSRVSSYT